MNKLIPTIALSLLLTACGSSSTNDGKPLPNPAPDMPESIDDTPQVIPDVEPWMPTLIDDVTIPQLPLDPAYTWVESAADNIWYGKLVNANGDLYVADNEMTPEFFENFSILDANTKTAARDRMTASFEYKASQTNESVTMSLYKSTESIYEFSTIINTWTDGKYINAATVMSTYPTKAILTLRFEQGVDRLKCKESPTEGYDECTYNGDTQKVQRPESVNLLLIKGSPIVNHSLIHANAYLEAIRGYGIDY